MCPHHGARFDLNTGRSLSALTPNCLRTYPVQEEAGVLSIDLGEPSKR